MSTYTVLVEGSVHAFPVQVGDDGLTSLIHILETNKVYYSIRSQEGLDRMKSHMMGNSLVFHLGTPEETDESIHVRMMVACRLAKARFASRRGSTDHIHYYYIDNFGENGKRALYRGFAVADRGERLTTYGDDDDLYKAILEDLEKGKPDPRINTPSLPRYHEIYKAFALGKPIKLINIGDGITNTWKLVSSGYMPYVKTEWYFLQDYIRVTDPPIDVADPPSLPNNQGDYYLWLMGIAQGMDDAGYRVLQKTRDKEPDPTTDQLKTTRSIHHLHAREFEYLIERLLVKRDPVLVMVDGVKYRGFLNIDPRDGQFKTHLLNWGRHDDTGTRYAQYHTQDIYATLCYLLGENFLIIG